MSQLLQGHIDLLRTIDRSSMSKVDGIIKHSSNGVTKLYIEIALNVLKGIVPITAKERNKFSHFKPLLKILTVKHNSLKKKRDILVNNAILVKLLTKVVLRYFTK